MGFNLGFKGLILVQNQDTKLLHKKLNSGNNIGKNTPTQASSALTDCPLHISSSLFAVLVSSD